MCGSTHLAAMMGLGEPVQDATPQTHKHPCAFVSQTPYIRISGSFVALAIHSLKLHVEELVSKGGDLCNRHWQGH